MILNVKLNAKNHSFANVITVSTKCMLIHAKICAKIRNHAPLADAVKTKYVLLIYARTSSTVTL
jgi:hypothetical protein